MTVTDTAGDTLGFDEWSAAVSSAFVPLTASPQVPVGRFRGGLEGAEIGGLRMIRVRGTGAEIRRSTRTIRRADPGVLKVALSVSGNSVVHQHDRTASLAPGDVTVYDTSVPYRLMLPDQFDMLVAVVDRRRLPIGDRECIDGTARTISGADGIGSILRPAMLALHPSEPMAGLAQAAALLEAAFLDLVAASLRTNGSADPPASGDAVYLAARDHIEAHLAEPNLSPASVAAHLRVSLRYLQKLFAANDETPAAYIRRRRLERSRRDLADPLLTHRSVAAIAAAHGFVDGSHFSRVFHAAYGLSPRDFRQSAK
ncbi:helix-turn-helix domain-containing protein [Gordonia sp. CPCC 205515]|uniref:helix-turn-helix domain-containing protein n=1 Tax=Gordonia sp. CPCC 205515 TaxID=3140791 RepID=UPI003AF3EE40